MSERIEELKSAVKILRNLAEEEKRKWEERLQLNVKTIVLPLLEKLKVGRLNSEQKSILELIDLTFTELTSGFAQNLQSPVFGLTPKELQIADMIKSGKTTKEIANILMVSIPCINFHRQNIRKKLGLTRSRVSLMTHLLSFID